MCCGHLTRTTSIHRTTLNKEFLVRIQTTLTRLAHDGHLVRIDSVDDARGNVNSSAALEQVITADLTDMNGDHNNNRANLRGAVSPAHASYDARSPSDLTTHDSASVVAFPERTLPTPWPAPPATRPSHHRDQGEPEDTPGTPGSRTTHYTTWEETFTCGRAHATCVYHVNTRLEDGRVDLLIDPGSVGNLCGDKWARELATLSAKYGQDPKFRRREKPLQVSGVGVGSQQCVNDYILLVALQANNMKPSVGSVYRSPAVQNSELPGLLGLSSLRDLRVVLDLNKLTLHFCGPGYYDLSKQLPPGTDSYPLEIAPSGHLLLPCSNFEQLPPNSAPAMTLLATSGTTATTSSNNVKEDTTGTCGMDPPAGSADASGQKPPAPAPTAPPPEKPPVVPIMLNNAIPEVPKGTP